MEKIVGKNDRKNLLTESSTNSQHINKNKEFFLNFLFNSSRLKSHQVLLFEMVEIPTFEKYF